MKTCGLRGQGGTLGWTGLGLLLLCGVQGMWKGGSGTSTIRLHCDRDLLNISDSWPIYARDDEDIISGRECSKKSAQQGRSVFGAGSVQGVREQGKKARTTLAAFFSIPLAVKENGAQ